MKRLACSLLFTSGTCHGHGFIYGANGPDSILHHMVSSEHGGYGLITALCLVLVPALVWIFD